MTTEFKIKRFRGKLATCNTMNALIVQFVRGEKLGIPFAAMNNEYNERAKQLHFKRSNFGFKLQ